MKNERQQLDAIDAKVARTRSQFDEVARELTRLYEIEMQHKALTQTIIRWIARTNNTIEGVTESSVYGYLITLVEDIEKLCKKQTDVAP